VAALLVGCLGGSDGVENPKMELQFSPEGGGAAAGRVSLYAGNLNPALDSTPFATKDMIDGKVTFQPEELDAVVNRALAAAGKDTSVPKDTILRFNVVASANDREAFVGGLAYRRAGKTAGWTRYENGVAGAFGSLAKSFILPKAVPFTGRIGRSGALLGLDYVFIPGSPYHSPIAKDSTFSLARMAPGSYGIIGADKDSAHYYESDDTLSTADTAYSAKAWSTVFFIPDH
jgi:hypothetical protein